MKLRKLANKIAIKYFEEDDIVEFVDNSPSSTGFVSQKLTLGKKYKIEKMGYGNNDNVIIVSNDNGSSGHYYANRFKKIW